MYRVKNRCGRSGCGRTRLGTGGEVLLLAETEIGSCIGQHAQICARLFVVIDSIQAMANARQRRGAGQREPDSPVRSAADP